MNEGRNTIWQDIGIIAGGVEGVPGSSVRFAQLDKKGVLDYLSINDAGTVQAWLQIGDASRGDAVRFHDLDGDGRADMLWISPDGEVSAWLNTGLDNKNWKDIGVIAKLNGVRRDKIQFADIDGDKKADFLIVYPNGAVDGYRNNGALGIASPSFDYLGQVATGVGEEGRKVRWADVDGSVQIQRFAASPC